MDISDSGVRLHVDGFEVPDEFVLVLTGHRVTQESKYKVVWRLNQNSAPSSLVSFGRVWIDLSAPVCRRRRAVPATVPKSPKGIYRCRAATKSPLLGLMPANLITLAHFSMSSAKSLPRSAGESAAATPESGPIRAGDHTWRCVYAPAW